MGNASTIWFYFDGAEVKGPFTEEDLYALKTSGEIDSQTMVCREGEENWIAFEGSEIRIPTLPNIAELLTPPPLPKASQGVVRRPAKKAKKLVIASKTQIVAVAILLLLGLVKLLSPGGEPSRQSNEALAMPVVSTSQDFKKELKEKIQAAESEMMSLGMILLKVKDGQMSDQARWKLLKEAAVQAKKISPMLHDISKYRSKQVWSNRIVIAFNILESTDAGTLITEPGWSGANQSLRQIQEDMLFFPNGKKVHF